MVKKIFCFSVILLLSNNLTPKAKVHEINLSISISSLSFVLVSTARMVSWSVTIINLGWCLKIDESFSKSSEFK